MTGIELLYISYVLRTVESTNSSSYLIYIILFLLLLLILVLGHCLRFRSKVKNLFTQRKISMSQFCTKHRITSREQEVLSLLLQGKSLSEIENEIFISINTIRNHVYSIYKKLNVKTRVGLVNKVRDCILPDKITHA